MEEAEVPLEHLHEHVKETAEHSGATWISWVALSTAILAVLAAIAGLLSGRHVNEAMMNQIEASDQWSYYQAKSIKASVLDAKISLASTPNESDQSKRDLCIEHGTLNTFRLIVTPLIGRFDLVHHGFVRVLP